MILEETKSARVIAARSLNPAALIEEKPELSTEEKLEKMAKIIQETMGYTLEQARVKNGKNALCDAKKMYTYFAREYTDMTLNEIGKYLGGRDHHTIITSLNRFQDYYDMNRDFRSKADKIRSEIKIALGVKHKWLGNKK
jgi:chromosomal replication initiator protein